MTSTPKRISLSESGTGLPCSRVSRSAISVDPLLDQIGGAVQDVRALVGMGRGPAGQGARGRLRRRRRCRRRRASAVEPTGSPVAGSVMSGAPAVAVRAAPAAVDEELSLAHGRLPSARLQPAPEFVVVAVVGDIGGLLARRVGVDHHERLDAALDQLLRGRRDDARGRWRW